MRILSDMDTRDPKAIDDVTIICQTRSWKINRTLLCNASKVIATMMNSGMKEAQTGEIEQKEFDMETVERMVSFVRSKEYAIDEEAVLVDDHKKKGNARPYIPPPVINDVLLAHAEMFRIGDFYDMDGLMSYTTKKIEEIGKHGWQPDRFLDVIKEVCNVSRSRRNEKSLCDALCAYTLQHRAQVMRDSTMMGIFKNDHEVQSFVAALFRGSVQ